MFFICVVICHVNGCVPMQALFNVFKVDCNAEIYMRRSHRLNIYTLVK